MKADQRAGVTISYKFRGLPHRFSLCEEAFGGLQAHGVKVFQQAVACQVLILVAEGGKVPPQPVGNEGDVQERVLVIFADIALHLRHQLVVAPFRRIFPFWLKFSVLEQREKLFSHFLGGAVMARASKG